MLFPAGYILGCFLYKAISWLIKRVNCSNKVCRSNLIKVPLSGKYRGSTSRLPRILLRNARSLWRKIDELAATLDAMRTDVAAITETWLHGGLDDSLVNIGGYTLHRRDRSGGRGGGVCLLLFICFPEYSFQT